MLQDIRSEIILRLINANVPIEVHHHEVATAGQCEIGTMFASLVKRAEAYLKSSGIGDTAYFGPEPEFFIFDSVTWHDDMSGSAVKINSEEAAWSSGEQSEAGNIGHRPKV